MEKDLCQTTDQAIIANTNGGHVLASPVISKECQIRTAESGS